MTARRLRIASQLSLVTAALLLAPAVHGQESTPTREAPALEDVLEATRAMARPLVEDGLTVGMVIGIVRGEETRVLSFGETTLGGGQAPDASSIYEIGSVSKVVTGILLADAVSREVVELDDTVKELVQDSFEMPSFEDHLIQLWHLSTHTSGLPRMPSNFAPADPEDPYADYTLEQMFTALERYQLRRAPGESYAYSNLAVGLLGNLLVGAEGEASYSELLRKRITVPLGLTHTGIDLDPWMTEHLVPGYDVDRNPKPSWNLGAFAGAGGIRSNATDMLRFARACLHPEEGPLGDALELSMQTRHRDPGGVVMGLGWHVASGGATRWHNGQTGGYHTYFAIWPEGDVGIVLLANTTSGWVDRCADNVLLLMMGAEPRDLDYQKAIPVDRAACEELVGNYELGLMSTLAVTLRDGRMYAQMSFQPELRIYPSAPDRFFFRAVEAELVFQRDEEGAVTGVEIEQGGKTTVGKRK